MVVEISFAIVVLKPKSVVDKVVVGIISGKDDLINGAVEGAFSTIVVGLLMIVVGFVIIKGFGILVGIFEITVDGTTFTIVVGI